MKQILILGGGMGGLVVANELKKKLGKEHKIILIDKNSKHIFYPSFPWLMLGLRKPEKIQKPLELLRRKGIIFVNDKITKIEPEKKMVKTTRDEFSYDYLVISLGAELASEKIKSLSNSEYNLYQFEDVERLRDALRNFNGRKVAIVISSLPFKCPAAPYEAAFLLDYYFEKKGIRKEINLQIFTPETLPMPVAGQKIGEAIKQMLEERGIIFNPEKKINSIDGKNKIIMFENNQKVQYDMLIYVPHHKAPDVVKNSKLTGETGWIPVNAETLETNQKNIYAIGDINSIKLPDGKMLPKAGVFAHYQAEVVANNIASEIMGKNSLKEFKGDGLCFLEIGFGKAGFARGNFYAEKREINMKKPSRVWHLSKILFEKYWFWRYF
ncbi:NAD(P)/FAD-dependent oxidoreductase [Candidatus Pacearchaeota archaeon]|nr:NAD(P)/FAD-dependent oxidoreductase [Candidatus Pacearchaeota archaeon]